MRFMTRLAALAAGLILCVASAPAIGQTYSSFPLASPLASSDFLNGLTGTGCATAISPCANVKVTPAQIATFVATAAPITSAYQPLDSDLTAIASLTTTSFGRSLLVQADAPTARTTLGLAIGTNVQAYNAALGQIAGLSPADGDFIERVSGAWMNRTAAQVKQDLGVGYAICKSAVASSITGTTTETTLATCTIPANAIGPNGQIEIQALWSTTNSANTKTLRIKFGSAGYFATGVTSVATAQTITRIANRNANNSQVGGPSASFGPSGSSTSAAVTSAIDTTSAVSLTFTAQLGNTSETITLESYVVRLTYGS